jgi:hypothetical protein
MWAAKQIISERHLVFLSLHGSQVFGYGRRPYARQSRLQLGLLQVLVPEGHDDNMVLAVRIQD